VITNFSDNSTNFLREDLGGGEEMVSIYTYTYAF
jgi:hypothetical protein